MPTGKKLIVCDDVEISFTVQFVPGNKRIFQKNMKSLKTQFQGKTPADRVEQFPDNGLTVRNKLLYCVKCKKNICHLKKDPTKKHVESKSHLAWKSGSEISTKLKTDNTEASNQWEELANAAVKAGIPIFAFSNESLREWMAKYARNGEKLPCQTTLRSKLKSTGRADVDTTLDICRNSDVCLMMDETTDFLARKVLNILVRPLSVDQQFRLLSTKFVEKVDSTMIVQAATDSMHKLELPLENLVVFVTDNAPYMTCAAQKLKAVCSRLTHTTCWSHILHLVSEELRDSLKLADNLISGIKKALLKCPARRAEYLNSMEKVEKSPRLPPSPVITRWATWLEAGDFHFQNLDVIQNWISTTKDTGAVVRNLKNLFANSGENLAQELERISAVFPGLSTAIKSLESNDVVSSNVWSYVMQIKNLLLSLGMPSQKLKLYLEEKHPALEFWQGVQNLDPRKCPSSIQEGLPPALKKFSTKEIPLQELCLYKTLSDVEINRNHSEVNAVLFWKKYSREMPLFSELSLKARSVPSSSADVERSFSYLKKLLSPQRSRFTEENLDIHMRVVFNDSVFSDQADEVYEDVCV